MPDLKLEASLAGSLPDLELDASGNVQLVSGLPRLEQAVKTDLRHQWGSWGFSGVRGSDVPALIESSFGALAPHHAAAAVREVLRRQPAVDVSKTQFTFNSTGETLDFDVRFYTYAGQPSEFNGREVVDA